MRDPPASQAQSLGVPGLEGPTLSRGDPAMRRTYDRVRVGGTWLAVASGLMIATLVLHGPIAPDLHDQMARIANRPTVWAVAHWIAAAGLSIYAVAGLVVLTSESRLTEGWWTTTALGMWFGIGLGSLVWLATSILMSVWVIWFGIALTRSPVSAIPTADAR